MLRKCLLCCVLATSVGCGTLFNGGSTTSITLRSQGPVTVDGAPAGMAPTTITVAKHANHTIVVGGQSCQLQAPVGVGWVVLDVLAGLVGIVIDAVTSDWKSVDASTCNL
jgi:hypothetical protein